MNKSNERVNEIDEMLLIADSDSKIIQIGRAHV